MLKFPHNSIGGIPSPSDAFKRGRVFEANGKRYRTVRFSPKLGGMVIARNVDTGDFTAIDPYAVDRLVPPVRAGRDAVPLFVDRKVGSWV